MAPRPQHLFSVAFLLVSLFAVANVSPIAVGDSGIYCPADYVLLGVRCYYFSSETAGSFSEAELKCSEKFSQLTTLSTPQENDYVKSYISANIPVPGLEGWWIGGVKLPDNGDDWVWTSNLQRIFDLDWCPGEPNDYGGEGCLSLNPQCEMMWNDRACDYYGFRYICETLPL